MIHLLVFCLCVFLILLPFASTINAEERSIDDLLIPDVPSMNDKTEDNQQLAKKPKEERNIYDLLGPKDNFPFLPDNHRDSGTGKFNSF